MSRKAFGALLLTAAFKAIILAFYEIGKDLAEDLLPTKKKRKK